MAQQVTFNVNTSASVALIGKLNQLNQKAMPLAIRGTLNSAAFDVKQRTLDESATQNFIRRTPTFFRRFSGVNIAKGYDISGMRAEVGMTALGDKRVETAINNMEKQEHGGKITEGLDYLAASRISQDPNRRVSAKKRFDKNTVVRGAFKYQGTSKSRKVAAAYVALRENKYQKIKIGTRNFYRVITSIKKNAKGGIQVNSKLIYVSRSSNIKPLTATHFSREAAERTQLRMSRFFNESAQRQINRVWK